MPTHMETVLRAAAFAAEKHRNQRRKHVQRAEIVLLSAGRLPVAEVAECSMPVA